MNIFKFMKKVNREVFLNGHIDDNLATRAISEILKLAEESKSDDIKLIINSPGGLMTSGFAIYDAIQYVECDISTVITGQAHGLALLIAASGTKGKRYIVDESIVGLVPFASNEDNNQIQNTSHKEVIDRIKRKTYSIFSSITGNELHKIAFDIENETYLSTEEAVKYGLVDRIINK